MNKGMKKTHWLRTTVIVLVVCALVGTVIAGVQFTQNKAATAASATLEMTFANAGDGKAPNGNRFDVQEMTSDIILESALNAAGLAETYAPDQIRSSLTVQGSYPSDLEEQLTGYVSVLNSTGGTQLLTVSDYHPTVFGVSLTNKFDPSISQAQLTSLLEQILAAYKTYFASVGANKLEMESAVFTLSDYDYPQQLQIIRTRLENLAAYAEEMNESHPSFHMEGKGFNDIAVRVNNLIAGDLSRMEGQVSANALAKDTGRLLTQYQYEVQSLTNQLKFQNENLANVEKLIDGYQKNSTIYVSTSGALNEIEGNTSETYDKLVSYRKELSDSIAETKAKLADYQQKIDDLTGAGASEEKTSVGEAVTSEDTAETQGVSVTQSKTMDEATVQTMDAAIESLVVKADAVAADFDAMIQAENAEQINELTVSTTAVRYSAPKLLSGAFLKQVIKSAGPFCAIGLMVCLMLIFISRRKEEKAKNTQA